MNRADKFVAAAMLALCVLFPLHAIADSAAGVHEADEKQRKVRFDELTFLSGYVWGDLKRNDNLEIIPFSVRIGFDINKLMGIQGRNTLQLGIEPFVNTILNPEEGIETGLNVGLRYITPLTDSVSFFGEVSSGPAYFSIDTVEQDDYGFNFISQFGAGLQFKMTQNIVFNAGYRFRHRSNAGLSSPNSGINTNMFLTGVSFSY